MVKSADNLQRRCLDMLAWSEGTDNGRQKTRNHGYDVIVDWRAIYWLLDHPRKKLCHAKPKTQINRRRTLPASFPLVDRYLGNGWKTTEKSEWLCGIAAD